MHDLFQKIVISLSQDNLYDNAKDEWMILCKEHKAIDCICGHKVKHCSTIYNTTTNTILEVGNSCCKKNGITKVCKNQLFINSIKIYRESNVISSIDNKQLEYIIILQIEKEYNHIFEKLELENEYYRIVPLNHLLNDLLDLQNNYQLSFMTYITEIKSDIELLEQKNDIYCQEEMEKTLENYMKLIENDEDLTSEISLLSLETESFIDSIPSQEIQEESIENKKEEFMANEKEESIEKEKEESMANEKEESIEKEKEESMEKEKEESMEKEKEESIEKEKEESIENKNYSLSELKQQMKDNEMERLNQLENLTKAIHENECRVRELIIKLKYLRENINIVREDMTEFTNKIKSMSL